jgi:hypothetical protein
MPKKTFTREEIVSMLRQIEAAVSQGKTVPLAFKEAGHRRTNLLPLAQGVWWAASGASQEAERAAERECATAESHRRSHGGKTNPEGYPEGNF